VITEDGLMKKKLEREAIKKKEGGKHKISYLIFIFVLIYCFYLFRTLDYFFCWRSYYGTS